MQLESLKNKSAIVIERYQKDGLTIHSSISYQGRLISYAFESEKHSFPAGEYHAYIYHSNKFKRKVLRMIIPNRTAMAIHPANSFVQLLGCIAPVSVTTPSGGLQSGQALDKLLKLLTGSNLIPLEVIDNYQVPAESPIGLS